jgi:hypothetical protein
MVTADQYRQYAKEALDWALGAETKADEMAALDLAHWWTLAAASTQGRKSDTSAARFGFIRTD